MFKFINGYDLFYLFLTESLKYQLSYLSICPKNKKKKDFLLIP